MNLELDLERVSFDEKGLVPVVCQDVGSGAVAMVAWSNREALDRTLETGLAWFWSRSRGRLWQKGESSGHVLRVRSLELDCDGDTILARVDASGPACHEGTRTCFGEGGSALELGWLADVIAARRNVSESSSYTARLLAEGTGRVAQKVGEEATEVVVAALDEPDTVAEEAADLLYHLLVLLESTGTAPAAVAEVLRRRHDD